MILNVGGGPTPDKPTVTLSIPDRNHINSFMNVRVADIQASMSYGRVEGPSSSRSRFPSTARFAATSAILTDISSRSDRAQTSHTVDALPGWDADLTLRLALLIVPPVLGHVSDDPRAVPGGTRREPVSVRPGGPPNPAPQPTPPAAAPVGAALGNPIRWPRGPLLAEAV